MAAKHKAWPALTNTTLTSGETDHSPQQQGRQDGGRAVLPAANPKARYPAVQPATATATSTDT